LAALAAPMSADAEEAIDLELFEKSEINRSEGCSVVLWQDDRDPDEDKYAYLFAETLSGENHTRQPARIKIGDEVTLLNRVATGGKTTGYNLYEYQLYRMPNENEFVILDLQLADEEGESVNVVSGVMILIVKGKPVFRATVKGNAGCATAAEPESTEVGPGMFERYPVRPEEVPAKITAAAKKQFGCESALVQKGVMAFQLSEEAAIWQIPCGDYGDKSSAVYAIVYIPDPSADFKFMKLRLPSGVERSLGDHALMDPTWDMKSRTVTGIHTEGNGSDCGQYERYQVTSKGEVELSLVEFREKTTCDGQTIAPKDFPLVFTAR
jgi:hypothetical protein